MPSITTWSRLEPNVRGASQNETLKARIYDPLWLLARQWQLGELQGDDNGTPVSARLRAECAELSRYVPQGGAARPVKFDPKRVPLEAFVEREAVHPRPGALVRLRVGAVRLVGIERQVSEAFRDAHATTSEMNRRYEGAGMTP